MRIHWMRAELIYFDAFRAEFFWMFNRIGGFSKEIIEFIANFFSKVRNA